MTPMYSPEELQSWLSTGNTLKTFARHHKADLQVVKRFATSHGFLDDTGALTAAIINKKDFVAHLLDGGSVADYARRLHISEAVLDGYIRAEHIQLAVPELFERTRDIIESYRNAKESGASIGRRWNMCRQRIEQIVRAHGVAKWNDVYRDIISENRQEMLELLHDGLSIADIAERYQLPQKWVKTLANDAGITPRKRHQQRREQVLQSTNRLRIAILHSKHSQREVAELIGETPIRLSNLLSGARPSDEITKKTCQLLRISAEWVSTGDPSRAPAWLKERSLEDVEREIQIVNSNIRLFDFKVADIMKAANCDLGYARSVLAGRTNGLLLYKRLAKQIGKDPAWFLTYHGGPLTPGGVRKKPAPAPAVDDGRHRAVPPQPLSFSPNYNLTITPGIFKEVIDLYRSGANQVSISRALLCSPGHIKEILTTAGVSRREKLPGILATLDSHRDEILSLSSAGKSAAAIGRKFSLSPHWITYLTAHEHIHA